MPTPVTPSSRPVGDVLATDRLETAADEPHTQAEPDNASIAAALEQARRGIAGEPGAAHGRSVTDRPAP